MTYGHAMIEFCYWRRQAIKFIEQQKRKNEKALLEGAFTTVYTILCKQSKASQSLSIYLDDSAKRKRTKIINFLSPVIHAKREDFNDFILGTKEDSKISNVRRIQEKLLASHLLSLMKAAKMQSRICEMQKTLAFEKDVKVKLREVQKKARKISNEMKIYVEKTRTKSFKAQ